MGMVAENRSDVVTLWALDLGYKEERRVFLNARRTKRSVRQSSPIATSTAADVGAVAMEGVCTVHKRAILSPGCHCKQAVD